MKIVETPGFKKAFKERITSSRQLVSEFREALKLFIEDPNNPILRDHQLTGTHIDKRAFWVTGDVRVVYRQTKEGILLYDIGTHPQVY